ncbi:hypothetical protein [Winogradskyella sp. R77965]|uniref:hypothetical protein n=1 Tax=Winogradskyella sp. R77965 TaxID=3093872 RepID=UPI0037DD7F73
MKKGIVLILFLIASLTGFAQQDVVNNEIVKPEAAKVSVSAKVKAKVLKMNRKKSNEIISIKAYRKSLQIRVKTKKLC